MTNYEKNKELLDMYAVADVSWGVDGSGKVSECDGCTDCIFHGEGSCPQKRLEWLQQEYKEPEVEVDWNKVPIDTPILVRDYEDAKLYLAKNYIDGKKSLGQCLDEVPTVNAIEILDNVTNGDMIKAVFPNAMVYNAGIAMDVEFLEDEEHWFNREWWNAPYKKESEE